MGFVRISSILGLVFLGSFSGINTVRAAEELDLRTAWRKVNLPYSLLELGWADECFFAPKNFAGCAHGLNKVLAHHAEAPAELIYSESDVSAEEGTLFQIGGFVVRSYVPSETIPGEGIADRMRRSRERQIGQYREWSEAMGSGKIQKDSFAKLLSWIGENRVKSQPEEESFLTASAINGYLEVVNDPHTYLIPLEYHQQGLRQSEQRLVGIGITYAMVDGLPVVRQVFEGGPAFHGGLRPKDTITAVDGKDVQGLESEQIRQRVLGQEGTPVTLTVRRGTETLEVKLTRALIVIPNVSWKLLEGESALGYVKLGGFSSESSCSEIATAITELKKEKVKGWILDLRNNPGGLVNQAQCIAGLFIQDGIPILSVRSVESGRITQVFNVTSSEFREQEPLVILVNSNSASASELMAAAFQDYQRAFVIGQRSFGKGTIQGGGMWRHHPGVVLFQTWGTFHVPSGRTNQVAGVIPDFTIANEEEEGIREEDLYWNVLPNLGQGWKQIRPWEVDALGQCQAQNRRAEREWDSHSSQFAINDFTLLYARDILDCYRRLDSTLPFSDPNGGQIVRDADLEEQIRLISALASDRERLEAARNWLGALDQYVLASPQLIKLLDLFTLDHYKSGLIHQALPSSRLIGRNTWRLLDHWSTASERAGMVKLWMDQVREQLVPARSADKSHASRYKSPLLDTVGPEIQPLPEIW